MRTLTAALMAAILAICAGCGRQVPETVDEEQPANIAQVGSDKPSTGPRPGEPGGLPDDRNIVEESPIDPKSGQGAGLVVQHYAALLEQQRWAEALSLWGPAGERIGFDPTSFERSFAKYAEIHAEIGAPGPVEGAAGSAFVDIPIRFYGKLKQGDPFSSVGKVTLRRINDVPGSTEEQRRWHIERVDVQPSL